MILKPVSIKKMKNSALKSLFLVLIMSGLFLTLQSCKKSIVPNSEFIWLPKIFSNHMILQQNQENPIWGQGTPGSNILVSINGENVFTKVAPDSSWKVMLPPIKAGGPYSMLVAGKDSLLIEDILAGEVWLASGQSNMGYSMASLSDYYADEIENCANDHLRFLTVGKVSSTEPKDDMETEGWKPSNSENILQFSAVAYFFAKEISREYQVPVGIINSSYGGTAIEQWISEVPLKQFPKYDSILSSLKSLNETDQAVAERQKSWSLNILKDFDYREIKDASWKNINAPETFEAHAYPETDGLFWLKRDFVLPENFNSQSVEIHLDSIDDVDATFVNGEFVGNGTWWDQLREYKVNVSVLKPGKNEIAIAVADFASNGGFGGQPEQMKILFDHDSIPLTGEWKCTYVTGPGSYPAFPFRSNLSLPSGLFKGMINPVIRYGLKGVIWYQGEANTNTPDRAKEYARLFLALINDWREQKNDPNLPFLYVQLANYQPRQDIPTDSNWALLRESQEKALQLKNTAMAVTIDIGEAKDIHPKNKADVGKRLFLAAERVAYHKDVVYSGPLFDSLEIKNNTLLLHFNHIGSGLITNDNKNPQGFAIAGADSVFYWADNTSIVDDKVVISSSKVNYPGYVRYAWADNPKCNLFNKEGLPAAPFRTDEF